MNAVNPEGAARVKVILKDHNLEAWVQVEPPGPVSTGAIVTALVAQGVIFGIEAAAVKQVAMHPPPGPFRVARGLAPRNGADAVISFFNSSEEEGGKPKELGGGRVDLREVSTIINVHNGDLLATKTPAQKGTPGKNVKGEVMPASDGRDVQLRAGKNAALSEDGLQVTATADGQPLVEGTSVSVLPVTVVSGNVDFNSGSIHFHGSVKIAGDVMPGFSVRATQDVEIGGMVEGGIIEAGGTVILKGGVRHHGVIRALGDVTVRFVDSESSVTTCGNLLVNDSVMHSQLAAGLAIKVGRKLIGGKARAGASITVDQVGVAGGTHTALEVRNAVYEGVRQELDEALWELKTLQPPGDLADLQLEEGPQGPQDPPFIASRTGFNPGVQLDFTLSSHHVERFNPTTRIAEVEGLIQMA